MSGPALLRACILDMRPADIKSLDVSHIEGLIPKQFGPDAVEVPGARSGLCSDLHLKQSILSPET